MLDCLCWRDAWMLPPACLGEHGCCTLQVIAAGDDLRLYAAKLWLSNPLNDNATHGGAMTALAMWPAGGD